MNEHQKRIVWGLSRGRALALDGTVNQNDAVLALIRSGDAQLTLTAQGKDAVHRFSTADQRKFANPEDLNADGMVDEPNIDTALENLKPAKASESKTSAEQKAEEAAGEVKKSSSTSKAQAKETEETGNGKTGRSAKKS